MFFGTQVLVVVTLSLQLVSFAFGGTIEGDECKIAISVTDGTHNFSTIGATTGAPYNDFHECENFGNFEMHNDVWFSYTPTESGTLHISTCGSATFDTRIALYMGVCEEMDRIACNDDGYYCPDYTSLLETEVQANVEYLIRLGGFSAIEYGTGSVTIQSGWNSCDEPLPLCSEDIDGNGQIDVTDLLAAISFWNTSGPPRPVADCAPLPNGDCLVNVLDLLAIIGSWGSCEYPCDEGWTCGWDPTDFPCDGNNPFCMCAKTPAGKTACVTYEGIPEWSDLPPCDGGCPAGLECVVTCCGEPRCMPLCETPIPGGCCLEYACSTTYEPDCYAIGGNWLGIYEWCEGNPCGDPSCPDAFECGDDPFIFECGTEDESCMCFGTFDVGTACVSKEFETNCWQEYAICLDGDCPEGYACIESCCNTPLCYPLCGTEEAFGACCFEDTCSMTDSATCSAVDGHWYGYGSICEKVLCNPACPFGEIQDCNGNCAPIDWLNDAICDDGSYEWNDIPIYFNCPEFLNDFGDCD